MPDLDSSFLPTTLMQVAEVVRNFGLVIGGIAAFGVAIWALNLNRRRTANDTERLRQQAQALENDRHRLENDTYVKAIEQLGHDKMEVRLGAIYALERIARDAEDFDLHWSIMETLAAYIRERPASKWGEESDADGDPRDEPKDAQPSTASEPLDTAREPPAEPPSPETMDQRRPPTDVAAVFTVLKRRSRARLDQETAAKHRLDLRHTDLSGAVLGDISLERADLRGADLRGAELMGAKLWRAELMGADLRHAKLTGAELMGADLRHADLRGAELMGAKLWDTDLENAKFSHSPNDLGAKWDEANPPRNLDKIKIETV